MESESRKSPNASLKPSADFLQVSERTVLNLQKRGVLTPVYIGKRRFFRWAELEKLAKTGVA
jgi:hypothetical protein